MNDHCDRPFRYDVLARVRAARGAAPRADRRCRTRPAASTFLHHFLSPPAERVKLSPGYWRNIRRDDDHSCIISSGTLVVTEDRFVEVACRSALPEAPGVAFSRRSRESLPYPSRAVGLQFEHRGSTAEAPAASCRQFPRRLPCPSRTGAAWKARTTRRGQDERRREGWFAGSFPPQEIIPQREKISYAFV